MGRAIKAGVWTLIGATGGQMTLILLWILPALSQEPLGTVGSINGGDDLSLFGLVKYLAVSVPALAILFVQIWLGHKAQLERERREEERDKRLFDERATLVKEFTETARASLIALSSHGQTIQNLTETAREHYKDMQDLARSLCDQILRRVDSISALDRRGRVDP